MVLLKCISVKTTVHSFFTSDGVSVTVKVSSNFDLSDFKVIKFIEVGGKVLESNVLEMEYFTDLKDNFGNFINNPELSTYNDMLQLASN